MINIEDISLFTGISSKIIEFSILFSASFIVIYISYWILTRWMSKVIKRTKIEWDDVILNFFASFGFVFRLALSIYVSLSVLDIKSIFTQVITAIIVIVMALNSVKSLKSLFRYFMKKNIGKALHLDQTTQNLFVNMFGVLLWIIATILVLQNLGVDVSALLGGLGIFGLAVAFSLQTILEDIFAFFTIHSDRPFSPGDFIVTGSEKGTIKKIGLKSTRLETLSGEELVINNRNLINSYIHNYKKMEERRIVFKLGVSYETTPEQLVWIKKFIFDLIDATDHARVDRVHFSEFGDSALLFEISYYITTSDYVVKMDAQEKINIEILKAFSEKGIEIAYPTQTLYIKKTD